MNNTLIYARVSSKDQEIEGYSIPAQLKLLHDYALKNNLCTIKEFVDVETAKKAGRKEFSKMVGYIHENKDVKHVLVEKTDRLLRNITDYALIDRLIEYSDIKIHLVKENTILSRDSRSNEKFIFGIKALMAKNYVDNLSEEVRKGMAEKAAQGTYPSFAPYGYINTKENDKKIIALDPEAARFVKKMFELYATGNYSIKTLRQKMVTDGMVYRKGKKFYKSTLETILKNEFYTGVFTWKGKRYENASHPAIINKELFQQVQKILENPRKSKSRKAIFTYSNMITCGICGCSLTAEIKKEKYIYYHCTGHKGNCQQGYLRQEVIDHTFENLLNNLHITEDMQRCIMRGIRDSLKDKILYHNQLVQQLENQIKRLQNRIEQAYLDKLDGKISEIFWKTSTDKWMLEKDEFSIKLRAIQKADTHYLENANLILELAKKASTLFKNQNADQKRRLINILVSNCSYKGKKFDVELNPEFKKVFSAKKTEDWWS